MTRILADVGGTRARFAWQSHSGGALQHITTLECASFSGPAEALAAWLARHRLGPPVEAALALATPISDEDELRMTNGLWRFSRRSLTERLGLQRLELVNDFTALAMALPALEPEELRRIGGHATNPFVQRQAVGLLGPGTGLGVSGLLPGSQGSWIAIAGEGGHVSLPSNDPLEDAVLQILRAHFGHVSAERVLSGEGLRNLWGALQALESNTRAAFDEAPSPGQISELALREQHPLACRVVEVFCALLGQIAGNLALTLGATGGVFLGGGIVPQWGSLLERSRLRACFEAKGRFRAYLEAIPLWVIDANEPPALRGAARLLDEHRPGLLAADSAW
jgi:glucokinase